MVNLAKLLNDYGLKTNAPSNFKDFYNGMRHYLPNNAVVKGFDMIAALAANSSTAAKPTSDGGSKPSDLERFLRDEPGLNYFTTAIADQMSEDRFRDDAFRAFGLSEDDDYYPSRSGLNYGGKGALNIVTGVNGAINSLKGAASNVTGVSALSPNVTRPTGPYADHWEELTQNEKRVLSKVYG